MTFAADVAKWAARTKQKRDKVIADVVIEMSTAIIDRTPVGDVSLWQQLPEADYRPGTLVNSWAASIGSVGNPSVRAPNVNGAAALAQLAAVAPSAAGNVFNFVNPAPYTRRIEFGWSSQAPAGMIRLTAVRFQQIVRLAVRGN